MIREGIADVANGHRPKGVLKEDHSMIDLDIGVEEFEIDKVPEATKDLLSELQRQLEEV